MNMRHTQRCLLAAILPSMAGAQTYTFPYSCTQSITMRPPVNSRWDFVEARQFTHCHSWYFASQLGYDAAPLPQNPGFHTHGIDQRTALGWFSYCLQPCAQVGIPIRPQVSYVDPSLGTGPNGFQLRTSLPSVARAEAFSRIDVPPWSHGQPITAAVHASGFRQHVNAGFWSRSFALSEVVARAYVPGAPPGGPGGVIIAWNLLLAFLHNPIHTAWLWSPPLPQSRVWRLYDPIEVEVVSPDGTSLRETALDMYFDLLDAGDIDLEEGRIIWNAPQGDFRLRWGAFGSESGWMALDVRDGAVVRAESSLGVDILPPVGASIPFTFNIPPIELYLPLDRVAGYPYSAAVSSGDAGLSAPDSEPPCSADWNLDGFTDFFDYDEFVACFESGVCGWRGSADVNDDGFTDFFDYDAFVELFEHGC